MWSSLFVAIAASLSFCVVHAVTTIPLSLPVFGATTSVFSWGGNFIVGYSRDSQAIWSCPVPDAAPCIRLASQIGLDMPDGPLSAKVVITGGSNGGPGSVIYYNQTTLKLYSRVLDGSMDAVDITPSNATVRDYRGVSDSEYVTAVTWDGSNDDSCRMYALHRNG